MELELNYLSEKIDALENNIATIHETEKMCCVLKEELKSKESELEILTNILNALTISEITK